MPTQDSAAPLSVGDNPVRPDGNGHSAANGPGTSILSELPLVAGVPVAPPRREPRTQEEAIRYFRARRRSLLWAGLCLLSILFIVESLILSPWTDSIADTPRHEMSGIPLSDVQPYGVNVFLHKEVDRWKKEKTLDMASDMGATWIKQQFPWAEIEFSKGQFFDAKNNQNSWQKFDDIVALAEQRGLRIIARIDSTPEWARTDGDMPAAVKSDLQANPKVPPSSGHLKDFGDFIRTFVTRYRGRVPVIQVWNEPNLHDEWPTGVNAIEYVKLLSTAYLAAKDADPNIIVLAAPLSMTTEQLSYNGNLNEIDYLQAMYYAGAKPFFDAMSANAYGKQYAPEDPPSPQKLNFRRVELLRKVMERSGDSNKAIWFNEYGWNATPADFPVKDPAKDLPWDRVTAEQQADYTVRGVQYAQDNWPWAGVFTIWYLRQVGDIPPTKSEYYFSLVNPEFVPQPAYSAVQSVSHNETQVATPGDWGPVDSPVQEGSRWSLGLDPALPGGLYISPAATTLQGRDSLSVVFAGTDVALKLVPPAASENVTGTTSVNARYIVTVDGTSSAVSRSLPRDSKGQAYIELPANGQATEVKVVSGLAAEFPTGKHRLNVSVAPTGVGATNGRSGVAAPSPQHEAANLPGIGGIRVEANRSYVLFTIISVLLLAGIGIQAWSLRQSRRLEQEIAASPAPGAARGR